MEARNPAEAAAWKELEQRMSFLAEVIGRGDVDMAKMAAARVGDAIARFKPLYEARLEAEISRK